MCKILALSNVSKVKITPKFIELMRDLVCKDMEKDGFGFAVSSKQGSLWGDKTTTPHSYTPYHKYDPKIKDLGLTDVTRLKFGTPSQQNHALIAHGRYSTNTVSIENTHPYLSKEYALIHNGVVSDPNKVVSHLCKTNNDTEILMHLWEKNQIEAIAENAGGYYAIAILDRQGQLHIVRDYRATLYLAYSRTIDSFVIATTEKIVNKLAKAMRWSITKPELITDNSYIIFNGSDVSYKTTFEPIKTSYGIVDSKVVGYTAGDTRGQFLDGYVPETEWEREELAKYYSFLNSSKVNATGEDPKLKAIVDKHVSKISDAVENDVDDSEVERLMQEAEERADKETVDDCVTYMHRGLKM